MDELLFYKAMLYYKDKALEHYIKIYTRNKEGLMLSDTKERVLYDTAISKVNSIYAALWYLKEFKKLNPHE